MDKTSRQQERLRERYGGMEMKQTAFLLLLHRQKGSCLRSSRWSDSPAGKEFERMDGIGRRRGTGAGGEIVQFPVPALSFCVCASWPKSQLFAARANLVIILRRNPSGVKGQAESGKRLSFSQPGKGGKTVGMRLRRVENGSADFSSYRKSL